MRRAGGALRTGCSVFRPCVVCSCTAEVYDHTTLAQSGGVESLAKGLRRAYVGGAKWWLFPRLRGFWENVRQFNSRLRTFLKVKISSRTQIPLFRPGSVHSGSAN